MLTKRSLLIAAAALVPLFGMAGGASAQEAKKIGLAVANLQADFFNQIKQSVEAYAKEKGIEVITVDAKGNSATQVSQVQDLITQNIDALIYIPAGATAATVPTKTAKAAGIPVINVDRNANGAPGDTFIATDSVNSAKAVCDYIAKQAGGKGEMVIIHGQKGTTPEVDRSKGCGEALQGISRHQDCRRALQRAAGTRTRASSWLRTCSRPIRTSRLSSARPTRWRSALPRRSRSPISATRSGSLASTVT